MKTFKKLILFLIPKAIKNRIKYKTFFSEKVPFSIQISNGSNIHFCNNEILNQKNVYLNILSKTPGLYIDEIKEFIKKSDIGLYKIIIQSDKIKNIESGFKYIMLNKKGETKIKDGIPGTINPYSNTYVAITNSKKIRLNKNAHFILNNIEPQSKIIIEFYEENNQFFTKFEKFVLFLNK